MENLIINREIAGYKTIDIKELGSLIEKQRNISDKTENGMGNTDEITSITIVLDSDTNGQLYNYYNIVKDILISPNKLYIIIAGQDVKIARAICTLMATFKNYNIYTLENPEILDKLYLDQLLEREPTYEEVQTFIGSDITAYSDINTVVLGITSIVNSGELDGLKTFIGNHINTIESFPEIIDYMKKIVDTTNTGELFNEIDRLKSENSTLKNSDEQSKEQIKGLNDIKAQLTEDLEHTKKELGKTKIKADELAEQLTGKETSVIRTYPELNTSIMKCKVMNILYFKEVSYVQYANSMINALVEALKAKKIKFKLLIYDNKSNLSNIYRPAPIVGSTEYLANKSVFLKSTERLVVVEPNPMIIEDVLTFDSPAFDLVIVYDRLKQSSDIVTGNNVYKYFVINSYKDYIESRNLLQISDASIIITHTGGTLHTGVQYIDANPTRVQVPKERMDIPFIENYDRITNTARVAKYMKLNSGLTNKPIINSIFERMRI